MKQRFAYRTLLNISVDLRHNGVNLGCYRTRDIDEHAVFIEAPDSGLELHSIIEVDFRVETGSWRKFRRKGVIIRKAGDGFVVAFVSEDTVFFDTLEDLMKGEPARHIA